MEKDNVRLQKVLQKAKQETEIKNSLEFGFVKLFATLLVLIAPFFQKKQRIDDGKNI